VARTPAVAPLGPLAGWTLLIGANDALEITDSCDQVLRPRDGRRQVSGWGESRP
jgi:hypothetical protein